MEQQIQDLIKSIKKDGIETAESESKKIIDNAKKEAEKIISDANKEKERIVEEGKRESKVFLDSSLETIRQALRDASLSLKDSLEEKLNLLLTQSVSSSFDATLIKELVLFVVKAEEIGDEATLVIPEDKFASLASELKRELASLIDKGLELKTSNQSGIKVIKKDGSAYIDLSSDEIEKLLYPYLSSNLKNLL